MARSKKSKNTKQVAVVEAIVETPVIETLEPEKVETPNVIIPEPTDAEKAAMKAKMNRLLEVRQQQKALKDEDDVLKAEVHDFMKKYGIEISRTTDDKGEALAEVKMVKGSRRDIDVHRYYERVGLDKTLDSVKVRMTEAKRFVPEATLNEISTKSEFSYVKVGALAGDTKKIVYFS